jgi:glycosyltransferase involved in cell wall biosynthesis
VYTDANIAASPLRIVLPVHHFLPAHTAGAELYTAKLAHQLRARGHDVEVVTVESAARGAAGELSEEVDVYDGIPVHRLSFNLDATPERDHWLFDNPLLGAWFDRYCREVRPDLIHFQAGYLLGVAPIFAAAANHIPTVLTLHDYWFICPRHTLLRGDGALCAEVPADPAVCAWCNTLMKRRYQVMDRLTNGAVGEQVARFDLLSKRDLMAHRRARLAAALARVDALIAPSDFMTQMMADVVDRSRIEVIRFGFDQARPLRAAAPAEGAGLRIGFIGQVNEHKGVHLLVEAFRRVQSPQPLTLEIYGNIPNPDYRQRLARLAGNDPRIHFHGRYENARVADILASLTVCVAPSTWYENSPLAIQEAQVAQVPVITAALGGMQELVEDGVNGLHFTPRSVDNLAVQLQRLVDESGLLARLQQGAGAKQFRSVGQELDDIERVYRRVLAHKQERLVSIRHIT